jgi:hypothetical protein
MSSASWASWPAAADVALRQLGFINLPEHAKAGGFDHAAVHEPTAGSTSPTPPTMPSTWSTSPLGDTLAPFPSLPPSPERWWPGPISSSRRTAVRTPSACSPPPTFRVDKIAVGSRPNGLAYDHRRARLLIAGSFTVSIRRSWNGGALRARVARAALRADGGTRRPCRGGGHLADRALVPEPRRRRHPRPPANSLVLHEGGLVRLRQRARDRPRPRSGSFSPSTSSRSSRLRGSAGTATTRS